MKSRSILCKFHPQFAFAATFLSVCLILIVSVYPWFSDRADGRAQDPQPEKGNNPDAVLHLKEGDHICLVGNALGERMQHFNYWETLLHTRFPEHHLVVRNLCFPADEPYLRMRSLNFGTPDEHLKHNKADVILYLFGFNESFAGPEGVEDFSNDLTRLVKETKANNFSGKGSPRIVLISPIAHEDLGDPNIADGKANNENLELYTAAMSKVAQATSAGFVDLYHPTKELFEKSKENLTINGVHLSEKGYKTLAPILDQLLFGKANAPQKFNSELKAAIDDKNFHWWHRYRAVNGYYIYGGRAQAGSDGTYDNKAVMERELAVLEQMCANRDRRVWALAQGKEVPEEVDDSNTLPLIQPKSNVGKNKRNDKKVGELEYLTSEEQLKTFKLAPGFQINLFASEEDFPELANPVAINFDNKGRLWVAVMPTYPQWKPKTTMRDKLLILEDTDGDGRADQKTVFVDGLHLPTGFEFGYGGVFVAQQPDILFLKDTDGDDKADVKIRKLMGFDSTDSHHGLAAFEWGPGGALYFQEGTFKQSQVETPYGPKRLSDGGIWRYEPRTEKFEVYVAFNFANPWGHVFDRWGQNFLADASPGLNYWATPISGRIQFPDRHPGGRHDKRIGHPISKKYPTFVKKRIRPSSGCEIVSSRNFPTASQGNFLLNNVIGDRAVLQFTMREENSGFTGEEVAKLVESKDGNFRPVDLQFGPDGALYICDWHNALIGHLQHNLRDPNRDYKHGRIWRVTYKDRPLVKAPKLAGAPIHKLLDLLKEPEYRTRYRVRRELTERKTEDVIAAVKTWVANLDQQDKDYQHHLLEALWLHQSHSVMNEELLKQVLESPQYHARAAATRVLCYMRDHLNDPYELLAPRINDAHPRVRLEAVRACSFLESDKAIELALDVLNYDMDYYLEYTLEETLRTLERTVQGVAKHGSHEHHPGHHPGTHALPKPRLFLNKSPKVVQFQLERLNNAQLMLLDKNTDDVKYEPVFKAILLRPGISIQDRLEALSALNVLNDSQPVDELLSAVAELDSSQKSQRLVAKQLSSIILTQPAENLAEHHADFQKALKSENGSVRAIAYAGLVTAGQSGKAWKSASKSSSGRREFLVGVTLIPNRKTRISLRDYVLESLAESQPIAVRRQAIRALGFVPAKQEENFHLLSGFVNSNKLRTTAVRTLLRIPKQFRTLADARRLLKALVRYAEATPAAKRTSADFLDAMHLADELLAHLPVKEARTYRARLREVTVRVVVINTVQEEMRYDKSYFAVEAGRAVQIVLQNEDLMPHNLVVTVPGAMKEVALQAELMSPTAGKGKQFVPTTKKVLFATAMVHPDQRYNLTFSAPEKPGEYPFVCTFPGHWHRMYGVMVVVEDLDAWLANPKEPADPLGNNRSFVKNWTMDDFKEDLLLALKGRDHRIGQRLFKEANCIQCHKAGGEGGEIGPDLTEVFQRWKGDPQAVLREILEPSHKVEPKYAVHTIVTSKGAILAGIVTKQDRKSVTIITNPQSPTPQVIPRNEIEEMIKSSNSMMPRALLDQYTRDEIFEILAYLKGMNSKE